MVRMTARERAIIAQFRTDPDPDQLELIADEALEPLRDRRLSQSEGECEPMREARADE